MSQALTQKSLDPHPLVPQTHFAGALQELRKALVNGDLDQLNKANAFLAEAIAQCRSRAPAQPEALLRDLNLCSELLFRAIARNQREHAFLFGSDPA